MFQTTNQSMYVEISQMSRTPEKFYPPHRNHWDFRDLNLSNTWTWKIEKNCALVIFFIAMEIPHKCRFECENHRAIENCH